MNLQGAIVEQQNSLLRFYRKLEERFEENSVIKSLWREMADDISSQIQSIKSLPPSTWNQFKNAPNNSFESAVKEAKETAVQTADVGTLSMRDCFEASLQLAEPVVLKIYARLIRTLRKNSTSQVLNFYILVKTYVARLLRTTQSFAGDPLLIRRAQLLLAGLEKEVQEPDPEIRIPAAGTMSGKKQKTPVSGKTDTKAAKETTKAASSKLAAKETVKTSPEKVKAVQSKPAKETAKVSPVKVKPVKETTKVVPSKPAKTIPVKTKGLPEKLPAKTKRAR